MNRKIIAAIVCCLSASVFLVCQNQGGMVKDPIVRVGNVTIGKESFDAFQKTARIYPAPLPQYFPGSRQFVSYMAETEAIYQYMNAKNRANGVAIKAEIDTSLDWAWKKRYFTAAMFFDILSENLGFTDAELEARYGKGPAELFMVTVRDSEGQDSTFIPAFDAAKRQVADQLFYEKFPPDSAFLAKLRDQNNSSDHDSATVRNHWLYNVRSNPADFYMRRFFQEETGEAYVNSVVSLYGQSGNIIVSEDLDVIRSWVPQNRRGMRMEELIEWLYKWKVFAERAEKLGLTAKPEYKQMLHWAQRIEYVNAYLSREVLPTLPQAEASDVDRSLAELLIFDQSRRVDALSAQRVDAEFNNSVVRARVSIGVDGAIYAIRKSVGITYLQDEYRDDRSADPAELMAKADSLRDAAADMEMIEAEKALDEAEKQYRALANEFAFSAEGRRAMSELAKLLVDKYNSGGARQDRLLTQAVNYYRRVQTFETDEETLCNSLFMAGFIYDEHLKSYELAEVNYKWILRHTPNCTLASDAEFMIQNLGEPMTSIEEIQSRSMRQGRKVDFEEDEVAINE